MKVLGDNFMASLTLVLVSGEFVINASKMCIFIVSFISKLIFAWHKV